MMYDSGCKIHLISGIPLLLAFLLVACRPANSELFPECEADRPVGVILYSHGWHVGLLVPVNEQFTRLMPAGLHIRPERHAYAELGWGDRAYYTTPDPGVFTTLKAAFWPSASVVHLAGFAARPPLRNPPAVKVMLSEAGYAALLRRAAGYIETQRADQPREAVILGRGLYGDARFYASTRRYYLPKTSNRWVAALLEEAGAPINSYTSLSAGTLMRRSADFGEPLCP